MLWCEQDVLSCDNWLYSGALIHESEFSQLLQERLSKSFFSRKSWVEKLGSKSWGFRTAWAIKGGPWRPSYLPVTAPVPDVITTRLTLGVRLTEPVHGDGWGVPVLCNFN